MKKNKFFTCLICFWCLFSQPLTGQQNIFLDKSFKEASTMMPAQRKGMGAIGKYEFGPYKIISGKQGPTVQKSKTGIFSNDTRSTSRTKGSFVFTGPQLDTTAVNFEVYSVAEINENYGFLFRTLTKWSYLEMIENETFQATYTSSSDTATWHLVLAYPIGNELVYNAEITKEMMSKFKGELANSETTIEILPEYRRENGQPATVLKPVEGYIFVLQGATVAAVQTYPVNKMSVWLKSDLPANLKQTLSAAAASMLVRNL